MKLWRTIASLAAPKASKPPCPDCLDCPDGLPGEDPAFSAAITALGAKLAKADGRADQGEFEAFSEVFQSDGAAAEDVHRLYNLARQTTRGFESYARQIAKRYRNCPSVLEEVLDGLFHVAKADGVVTRDEISYLRRVAQLFGLSPLTFRRIRSHHLGAPADDPYVVLNVAPDASDDIVRTAWKRALSDSHPDRSAARGHTSEHVRLSEARSAALNAAFDQVMRERRVLLAAEPV